MADYSIEDMVTVIIHSSSPVGLMGQVVDGPRAIIRQREIAWSNPKPPDFYINKKLQAIVLGFDPSRGQLELSLRLMERNPWKGVEIRYPPGREVEGKVVGLIEKAAFVELEPSIDAFLPISELPLTGGQRIENWLWLNDQVRASVVEVIPNAHRIKISLRSILTKRENRIHRHLWDSSTTSTSKSVTVAEYLPKDTRLNLLRMYEEIPTKRYKPLRVLLIEDDEAFTSGLHNLLRSNGCQVVHVKDGEKALAYLKKQGKPQDLIICDWHLPGLKGHELFQQLSVDGCPSRMVMILDPVFLRKSQDAEKILQQNEIEILTKVDVFNLKVSLLSIIRELREKDSRVPDIQEHPRQTGASEPFLSMSDSDAAEDANSMMQSYEERLQSILDQVRHETKAASVLLLRLDPGRSLPEMEGHSGLDICLDKARPDLMYSPLEDVLIKKQETRVEAFPNSSRLEKLLALVEFQEFLGIPLPALESASYGLILLKEKQNFTSPQHNRARTSASLIAAIIQERRMIHIFQSWQAQNLIGQISSNMVHEVDNKLGGIELLVDTLQDGLREISRQPEKASDATLLRELEQAVEGIANAQRSASELRNWYLGLSTTDEVQSVDLKTMTKDMLRALKGQAQENNIILGMKSPEHPLVIRARPSHLQQVFMNLVLNSIQQMAELRRTGNIQIELSWVEGVSLPIQARFKDEGPGIHKQLLDQIFDFGFTTRKNGAGLGLTISRHITNGLKGRLQVEESHIFWGTTFLLELPLGE